MRFRVKSKTGKYLYLDVYRDIDDASELVSGIGSPFFLLGQERFHIADVEAEKEISHTPVYTLVGGLFGVFLAWWGIALGAVFGFCLGWREDDLEERRIRRFEESKRGFNTK